MTDSELVVLLLLLLLLDDEILARGRLTRPG